MTEGGSLTILGSFLCRQPGTARRSVHRPCRDVLRFLVSAVAGALCGMLLAGVAACEGRASPTHSQRHPNQRLLADLPPLPRPHTERDLFAQHIPCLLSSPNQDCLCRSWSGGIVARRQSERFCSSCLGQTIEITNMLSF